MSFSAKYYAQKIAQGILSGENACGTLQKALQNKDEDYFIGKATPTIDIILKQLHSEEELRNGVIVQNEKLRFALESVVQSLNIPEGNPDTLTLPKTDEIRKVVEEALGRKLDW